MIGRVVVVIATIFLLHGKPSSSIFDDPFSCEQANWEPPIREGETVDDRLTLDATIALAWHGTKAYDRREDEAGKKEYTYGEITSMGTRQLIHMIGLKDIGSRTVDEAPEPVIFYDLGSGAGKFVVQLFLENVADSVIGIELSEPRHAIALNSWELVQKFLPASTKNEKKRVEFRNENLLEADFSDATHIYASSLCLPDAVIQSLADQILENVTQNPGRLKVVAALSDLHGLEKDTTTTTGKQSWRKETHDIQMTWGRARIRIYTFIPLATTL